MDPCPFVRIVIGNLALKFPAEHKLSSSTVFDCKFKLRGFSTQISTIPAFIQDPILENRTHSCFNLNKTELDKLVEKSSIRGKTCSLKIEIFARKKGIGCGLLKGGKLLGSVLVPLDLKGLESNGRRGVVIQDEWVLVGRSSTAAQLHLNVKAEPDPRFVFQFDGEPECSPQVYQVNGNVKQPVFTCKFSFRNNGDRNLRSRSSLSEPSTSTSCFNSCTADKELSSLTERKGWSITIHDLSGSPIAAASMVTPFVPSQGSNNVSRSNPGAWLILRPGNGTWKPWGRLEAWREHGGDLGYRFEIIPDGATDAITLSNSTISTKNGGKFSVDITNGATPLTSPNSSFDLCSGSGSGSDFGSAPGSGSWAQLLYRGFVMSSTVEGDGKCSKPEVVVGVQHVNCAEDAAAFVALAAAMDLSMDASQSFTKKLRKELRQSDQE
ncbi:uncharacterized protein [Nicotiana tomentosiformis]|uniref:uncharacterized protein n=1 Tax=Nicotiana tomentosiformis TaxID=4098 RepID=UPI00051B4E48|nr:uncharacterized protein LOC104104441 [Nicotiana tomentosiformis]